MHRAYSFKDGSLERGIAVSVFAGGQGILLGVKSGNEFPNSICFDGFQPPLTRDGRLITASIKDSGISESGQRKMVLSGNPLSSEKGKMGVILRLDHGRRDIPTLVENHCRGRMSSSAARAEILALGYNFYETHRGRAKIPDELLFLPVGASFVVRPFGVEPTDLSHNHKLECVAGQNGPKLQCVSMRDWRKKRPRVGTVYAPTRSTLI